ncbi:hypothetical protein BC943DRAFT_357537 [Umbelopsis sp. AD052]|nr:hypothetical protein BC943DRAFT_357537 [Umbelopsis sp. AD052]
MKITSHMMSVAQTCFDKKQRVLLEQFPDNATPLGMKALTDALLLNIDLRSFAAEQYHDMINTDNYRCILGNNNADYIREQIEVTMSFGHIQRFFEATATERLMIEPNILSALVSYLQACAELYDIQETLSFPFKLEGIKLYTLAPSLLIDLQVASTEHMIALVQSMSLDDNRVDGQHSSLIDPQRTNLSEYESQQFSQTRKASFTALLKNLCSLCEISGLSCYLICKVSDVLARYKLDHSYPTRNGNSYAEITRNMVNSCMEFLCIFDEVNLYSLSTTNLEDMTAASIAIKAVAAKIMTMFHHQCSIIMNDEGITQDVKPGVCHQGSYRTIGLTSHFGRHIIQFALAKISSKPSSAATCLKVLQDILPDDMKENFSCMDVASQQLRLYWRDMISVLFPEIMKLNYLILSNNQDIVCLATTVIHQFLGLFSNSKKLHLQFKLFIQTELQSSLLRANDFSRLKDMSRHTKYLMYQNEEIFKRWLKFTGKSVYFQEMHDHFTSSFERVKMATSQIERFETTDGMFSALYA